MEDVHWSSHDGHRVKQAHRSKEKVDIFKVIYDLGHIEL